MRNSESILDRPATTKGALRRKKEAARILSSIDNLCTEIGVGGKIPTHTELMRRFSGSERTVLRALDELQRTGRIVRRTGSGTFVTDRASAILTTPVKSGQSERTIVALAMPDRSFFDRCVELLYDHTGNQDLGLVCRLLSPDTTIDPLEAYPGNPLGFIVFSYKLAWIARRLREAGQRVVVVGVPDPGAVLDFPIVHSDHEQGGYIAAKHLIQLGHDRLLYANLGGDPTSSPRLRGAQRAVSEARRSGRQADVVVAPPSDVQTWLSNTETMRSYFMDANGPTAVIAWNDMEATILMSAFSRAGIKVPDDVSIIGYDSLPQGEIMHPSLTSVDSAIHQQLRSAIDILSSPNEPPPGSKIVVLPALVVRESTSAPRS